MSMTFEVYRNEGAVHGTTKDWMIGISPTDGTLIIKYGKTGQKLKTSIVKTSAASTEMSERIRKKVGSGYYYVGQSTESNSEAQIINSDHANNTLTWSINDILDVKTLKAKVVKLAHCLHEVDLPENWTYEDEELVVADKSVIDLKACVSISGVKNNITVGGRIERYDPLPTLFLMAIAKDFASISFCNDANETETVEYFGFEHHFANPSYSIELLNDLAIALKLKKEAIKLFKQCNDGDNSFLQLRL